MGSSHAIAYHNLPGIDICGLVSLENGYNGFLPTPEQHKLGGYETWRARLSYLEVNVSTKITQNIFEMLDKLKSDLVK